MIPLPLFAQIPQLWYSLPLIVVISLVYAGTRHEPMEPILRHALRLGLWIAGFMGVAMLILLYLAWRL